MSRKALTWGLPALCGITFIVIAVMTDQIFEHVPHSEDEVAYIFQAKVLAQNRLTVPTPPNAEAFWSPFVVDYQGQRFGIKPPGWPLLLSLGVRLGAAWLVNAGLAILTLVLLAYLGYHLYGPGLALAAAGLAVVTPGFIFLSSSLLAHTASLFWSTLALVALYHAGRSNSVQLFYAGLAGLALGLAFLTRPFVAVGLGLPIALFVLIMIWQGEISWRILLWLVAGGLPAAALLPLYLWVISGNPTFNPFLLVWPYDRIGFGPDIGPKGYDLEVAIFVNTRFKLQALASGLFGWPGWSNLFFLPLPFLARRASRWEWLLLGTLAGLIFIHLFYWSFGGVDGGFPRYYYDALPALLLLTARGIQLAGRYLARWQPHLRYGPLLIVLFFFCYSFIWRWPLLLAGQKGKYNITPEPLQVVARANLSEPALVLVPAGELWSNFAAPFAANSPTLDGPVVFAIDWNRDLSQQVRQQFPDRTCWLLQGQRLGPCP